MKRKVFAAAVLTALAPLALLAAAQDGDKGLDVKGELKIGSHEFKMEIGRLYEIRAVGTGFQPVVNINPGFLRGTSMPFERDAVTHYFVPTETKTYLLSVLPPTFGSALPAGPLNYTLKVTRIPLSNKGLLKEEGNLTAEDRPYENKMNFINRAHHKPYKVKLEAGRFYVIDMVEKGKGIDPYLYLEDPDGKVVAADDDGGGFPNARIVFKAPRSGEYRVIATALGNAMGPYLLTVRKQLKEKE